MVRRQSTGNLSHLEMLRYSQVVDGPFLRCRMLSASRGLNDAHDRARFSRALHPLLHGGRIQISQGKSLAG
jgi:hypothetical protein